MAVQARVSLTNHCATATIHAGTTSAFQTGWPATNAKYPQQPFTLAKGNVGLASTFVAFDFGAPKLVEFVMGVNLNCTSITLALDDSSNFLSLTYTTTLTVSRNPWNRRYTWAHLLTTPQTVRYMFLRADSTGSVTDGATTFNFGGVWAGPLTALPSDIRWDERPQIMEPHMDVPLIGGGTSRVSTGRPYVELHARRLAMTVIDTPATGDDLGTWLELDRQMAEIGHFAWYFNRGNTAEAFIVRKMNASAWNVNQVVSEDELILHEVVGP